jgi:AmiR/NasT family two-component response regulator
MDLQRRHHLRVLVADGVTRHGAIDSIVTELGHEVIARDLEVGEVAAATAELIPDVALVCVGDSSARALALISGIVQEATCPVIAVLDASDPEFVNAAAQRGIFAFITLGDLQELQGALDIVLRRFAEFQSLEGAFGRRAVIERAKGDPHGAPRARRAARVRAVARPLATDGAQADRRRPRDRRDAHAASRRAHHVVHGAGSVTTNRPNSLPGGGTALTVTLPLEPQ